MASTSGSGFSLRVTPAELEKKAGEFTDIIDRIQDSFRQIEDIAARTKGYWVGEAGDKDRNGYAGYQEDIDLILRRLREHPTDLMEMAGIYREAESDVQAKNNSLRTDIIA